MGKVSNVLKILPIVLLLIVSCSRKNESSRLFEKAKSCIETAPDSAVIYLDSIILPETFLSKRKHMEYIVLKVQAKYKNYNNIKDDTVIFEAKRYFSQKTHNSQLLAKSYLYSGCVHDERQEYRKALSDYNLAFTTAELQRDSLIMYLSTSYIAKIYSEQNHFDKALEKHLQSINYISKNDKEKLASSYANISKMHCITFNSDSSTYYIDKALGIVSNIENRKLMSSIYQNAYVIYRECKKHDEARKYIKLSIETNADSSDISLYNLNLAELYFEIGEQDSTKRYTNKLINKIKNIDDKVFLASSYSFLSEYYSSLNMNDSALYYQDKLTRIIDKIREDNMQYNIYEVEKKYNYERLSNNYNKKINRHFRLIIIMLSIVIILIIAIFLLIMRKKKNEIELMRRNEQIIIEMNNLKNEFYHLENINNNFKYSVDNILQQRAKLIIKVHNAEKKYNNADKKLINELKEYVYGSMNKNGLKAAIDLVENTYPKLSSQIEKKYNNLNETEYNVCLLSMLPFSNREIANLMELGESSIAKSRTNIRRKIGAEGYGSDIADLIIEEYYKIEN